MARISYDEQTAAAFKAVREIPRDGLSEWRDAVRRHLRPSRGMTLVDIGAGTGAFAAAFRDWFDLSVLAVEPSAAMRDQIPRTPAIRVLEGYAGALPNPMIQLTPHGSPLSSTMSRTWKPPRTRSAAFSVPVPPSSSDRASRAEERGLKLDGVELVRWFPETARMVDTYPSVTDTCEAFAAAGFHGTLLSGFVRRTRPASRTSSARWTPSAGPTPRCAVSARTSSSVGKNASAVLYDTPSTANPQTRSNWLDLLVLR